MLIARDTQLISIDHESTKYFPPTFKRMGISVKNTLKLKKFLKRRQCLMKQL